MQGAEVQLTQNREYLQTRIADELQEIEDRRLALEELKRAKIALYSEGDSEFSETLGQYIRAVHVQKYDGPGAGLPEILPGGAGGAGGGKRKRAVESEGRDGEEKRNGTGNGNVTVFNGDAAAGRVVGRQETIAHREEAKYILEDTVMSPSPTEDDEDDDDSVIDGINGSAAAQHTETDAEAVAHEKSPDYSVAVELPLR